MAIGLSNGRILIYDIRSMVLASELEGPTTAAVQSLEFSNKGIFMAASWVGNDTCRVYSLHKRFAFTEVKQENVPVTSLSFDLYGGYLAVGTAQNMTISSYKNWKKSLTTLRPLESEVNFVRFDAGGRKIFVASKSQGEIKTLSLA